MEPIRSPDTARRRIVASRLREFFGYLLHRFSAGSSELLNKAERDSTTNSQSSSSNKPR